MSGLSVPVPERIEVDDLSATYPNYEKSFACSLSPRKVIFPWMDVELEKEARSCSLSEASTEDTDCDTEPAPASKWLYCFESSRSVLDSLCGRARSLFPVSHVRVFASTSRYYQWLNRPDRSAEARGVFVAGPKKAASLVELLVTEGSSINADISDLVVIGKEEMVEEVMCFEAEIKKTTSVRLHGVRSLAHLNAILAALGSMQ